jgi:hypothetical protein
MIGKGYAYGFLYTITITSKEDFESYWPSYVFGPGMWFFFFIFAFICVMKGFSGGKWHHEWPKSAKCIGIIGAVFILVGYTVKMLWRFIAYWVYIREYQYAFRWLIDCFW